jgi:uncharacterized protein YciI
MNKKYLFILALLIVAHSVFGQSDSTQKIKPNIKQFWLVILKTGPKDKVITDSVERNIIFAGHFSNMKRLHDEGILKAAGPFGENDFTWRGLFIFDCKTKEEAENYVKTDPSVAAGIFIVDIVPWWSEATGSFVPGKPKKEK